MKQKKGALIEMKRLKLIAEYQEQLKKERDEKFSIVYQEKQKDIEKQLLAQQTEFQELLRKKENVLAEKITLVEKLYKDLPLVVESNTKRKFSDFISDIESSSSQILAKKKEIHSFE